jgi:class 3 adenylate cyclase
MASARSGRVAFRKLNTVVFVDIVGSTELAATRGDEGWAELLEQYQAVVRVALANTGGEEMDTAGDGVYAVFSDPAAALAFGCSIGRIVEPLGLRVRVGAHTGTCWVAGEKCSGLTVSIGARIVAHAEPDEVLVSAAVTEQVADDARFDFQERSEAELKGVPGRWTLYSVLPNPTTGGDLPCVRRFSTQVRSSSLSGASRTGFRPDRWSPASAQSRPTTGAD